MIRRRIRWAPLLAAGTLAMMSLAPQGAEAAGTEPKPLATPRLTDSEQAMHLVRALGPPLGELASTIASAQGAAAAPAAASEPLRRPVQQLAAIVGALQSRFVRNPAAAKAAGLADALRQSMGHAALTAEEPAPGIGALREPLVPALQFFCPGFYAVSGLVLGSLPPIPVDGAVSAVDVLCKDLPQPAGPPVVTPPSGELSYFDARTTAELVRFGAQSAFLPGTPLVDQGVGLSAAAADSNGSSGFSASLYPGALVEAVPGVVALLGFPLTLPPLYPYIARAANPGPATSDASIVPSQSAAAYQFNALSSKAETPTPDSARAESALVKVAQPGLVEVAAAQATSTVERSGAMLRSVSRTRLQGIEIAGGFVSIGELVSTLSVSNTGVTHQAGIDHKVSLAGVRVLGIPVEVTGRGLVVSTAGADPASAEAGRQLAETVKAFNLEIQALSPVVTETVEAGGRLVEVVSPGLRIAYKVPDDVGSLPIPVAQAVLNNAQAEFKLGYTAAFSNVAEAAATAGPSAAVDVPASTGTSTGPAMAEPSPAAAVSGFESGGDVPPAADGEEESVLADDPSVGALPADSVAQTAAPVLEVHQPMAAVPVATTLALSQPARRNAYIFSLVLISVGLAVVGWRTVLYNPGPPRPARSKRPDGGIAT